MNNEVNLKRELDQMVKEKSSDYVMTFLLKYLSNLSQSNFDAALNKKNVSDFVKNVPSDSEAFDYVEFIKLSSSFLNDSEYLKEYQNYKQKLESLSVTDSIALIHSEGILDSKYFHSLKDDLNISYGEAQRRTSIKTFALYNALAFYNFDDEYYFSHLKSYCIRCFQSI